MKKLINIFFIFFGLILSLIILSPIYIIIVNSFKTRKQLFDNPLNIIFNENPFQFYVDAFKEMNFGIAFFNSMLLTIVSIIFITTFSSMMAWVLVRDKSKKSKVLFGLIISSMLIPFQVVMIPLVQWFTKLDEFMPFSFMDTRGGLIFMYIGFGCSMAVFLFHGFIKSIPKELEEAALIDGCSTVQVFFLIVYPLLKPIIMSVAILDVLWIWNDYLLPSIVLKSTNLRTIPLSTFYFFGAFSTKWNLALAGLVLTIIPVVVFFLIAQKHIIKGVTSGAIKG